MARPLLEPEADRTDAFHAGGAPAATSILVLVVVAAVAAIVVSLCTSGKNAGPWRQRRSSSLAPAPQEQDNINSGGACRNNKPQLLASLSGIGVKAAAVAKMVSWNRRSSPQEQDNDDGVGGGNKNKPQLLASLSGIGIKAAAVAKLVSWNRRSPPNSSSSSDGEDDGGGAAVAEEEALWKKTIIMGDKCRPLEFSGHIAYDSDGNPLPPPAPAVVKEDVAAGAAAKA